MTHIQSLYKSRRAGLWAKPAALLLALFVLVSGHFNSAWAQANAGVTGTVTDNTGAVVANASVVVTNDGTCISSHLTTSSAGTYTAKGLNPGKYTITVDAAGFKKAVLTGVNVDVSVISTLDFTLSNGDASETVEVTSSAIALNTTEPQLGSTIEPEVVAALPVEVSGRGRQIDQLQFLAPGVTGDSFSHRDGGGADFEQEIVYNGIPAPQSETEGYTQNFNPPFEMVQEFRVERSTFAAQFGLGQGALTYQMATGTNKYHGDLFEINRNNLFDSVGFFNGKAFNPTTNPNDHVPTDHENNYGFTVSGPISIPHLYNGHDKTFGHYSQEWYKENNTNTYPGTVPTAREKTGDFTDYVDGSGNVIPIFDPTTGKQFVCNGVANVICPERISPLSATLIPSIPDPDRPGLDSNKSPVDFINPNIQHVWGFTVDQVINQAQGIHFSMWHNYFHNFGFDQAPIVLAPNPLNSLREYPNKGSGYLLTYNNALTSHLAMTAGIGWIGEINNQFNNSRYSFPGIAGGIVPPNFTFDGQHTLTQWGTSGANTGSVNRKLGLVAVNNWLWSLGRHTFNIGGEFRRTYQDDNEEQTAGGQFNFSHNTTSDPAKDPATGAPVADFNTDGSAFASFLLGIPDSDNRANSQELKLRNVDLSPYVQDDIKLNPKLTLNLGIRWDIQVPFTENNNNIVYFNPNGTDAHFANAAGNPIPGAATKFGNCTGCAGVSRADTHFTHFGPRLGFAYKLSDKSVIQAGFAIAFLNGGAYEYGTNKVAVNYGNLLVGTYTRNSLGTTASAVGNWDTGTPILPNPPATPFSTGLGAGTQIMAFDTKKDGFAPYSQQWNVNYQRELPYNLFLTAAFIGNRVIHLPSNINQINQIDPKILALKSDLTLSFADGSAQQAGYTLPYQNFVADFGGNATVGQALSPYPQYSYIRNNFEGFGTAYYQSAQIEVDKRFTNGLSFLVGYTLSKEMDNASSGFSTFTNGGINKYNQKPEWAISSSDELQTLKVSGTYQLPIGPGKKYLNNKGITGQALGGWQIGWITSYQSGNPTGATQNGTPVPTQGEFYRPVLTGPLGTASYSRIRDNFVGKGGTGAVWNVSSWADSPAYTLADTKRNYYDLRNPPNYNEAANVSKKFHFGERFSGVLQVDYFNVLNRTRFNNPDQNIDNGHFGQDVNNQGSQISNRQGQAQFRLEF
ncbi:TonB-dependent receptor domain-containing protein [Granulicella aggregans]|uniref:TonB-dependent receptor domain-containing protein n=1 Tax=Granulicella aggregans TaxID=474949 RepID=UPI0021DF4BD1|nr:TonB-dependent receptor [Granulicella aggregans]